MEKYLVTINLDIHRHQPMKTVISYCEKKVTIGVFDEIQIACIEGNKQLEILEKHFELNPNYNTKDRLKPNVNLGYPIVANWYLKTPFEFFLKVETLHFESIEDTINNVVDCVKKYKEFKRRNGRVIINNTN